MINIKNKKAFTIIELIVVIAVLGILVLLGMPKLLGHVERSKIAVIRHDVRVAENKMAEMLLKGDKEFINEDLSNGWSETYVNKDDLVTLINDGKLFEKEGLVTEVPSPEKVDLSKFKVIPEYIRKDVKTKLPGDFYSDTGGKVYYEREKGSVVPPQGEENIAANCSLIGSSEAITQYFDEGGYFLTNQNKLYVIDGDSVNNKRLLANGVNKVSEYTNVGGTMYVSYDSDDGIRLREQERSGWSETDVKITDGEMKDAYSRLVLTTDGRLYELTGNEQVAKLLSSSAKQLVRGEATYGYITTDNHFMSKYTGVWTDRGSFSNITFIAQFNFNYNLTKYMVSNNKLYSWGGNDSGHLGNGTSTGVYNDKNIYEVLLPEDNKNVVDMKMINSNGTQIVFALSDKGNLYQWGGHLRNINTPVLYKTNVKSITQISGNEYGSGTNILLQYNDNLTEIIKFNKDSKVLYTETFLNNVSKINSFGFDVKIKAGNNLRTYNKSLTVLINEVVDVSEYTTILRINEFGNSNIYYKKMNGEYYSQDHYEGDKLIDKYEYDNYLGRTTAINLTTNKELFLKLFKGKICVEREEDYVPIG